MWFKNKTTKTTGELGEKIAAQYLLDNGYAILEKNYANQNGRRLGEIDIIVKKNREIIFIEVKTRSIRIEKILPEANINSSKLYKLNKIASHYIKMNNLWQTPYHFDAISIMYNDSDKTHTLKHIKDIFL